MLTKTMYAELRYLMVFSMNTDKVSRLLCNESV